MEQPSITVEKIIKGHVVQIYKILADGTTSCISQEFIEAKEEEVIWKDEFGDELYEVEIPAEAVPSFLMANGKEVGA